MTIWLTRLIGTTSACAENTRGTVFCQVDGGTTSACAENTLWIIFTVCCARNYLRVRGEYEVFQHRATNGEELPPRARRIRKNIPVHCHGLGTTSACAENTAAKNHFILFNRNYLRVRGEYRLALVTRQICRELPPRARRIPLQDQRRILKAGTTSACAENTYQRLCRRRRSMNYLRVRGEY